MGVRSVATAAACDGEVGANLRAGGGRVDSTADARASTLNCGCRRRAAGLRRRSGRRPGSGGRFATVVRASVQPGVRDRDVTHRSAASSAFRGLRADAEAGSAAVPARRRRRRREDDHDRPVRPRNVVAWAFEAGVDRSASGSRGQLAAGAPDPVSDGLPDRHRRRRAREQPVPRRGKRSRHCLRGHAGGGDHVRGSSPSGWSGLRPCRLRRGAQAERARARSPGRANSPLQVGRGAGCQGRLGQFLWRTRLDCPASAAAYRYSPHGHEPPLCMALAIARCRRLRGSGSRTPRPPTHA